ncbi:MAG: hypothetical protein FD163_2093 [Hyphomonadaceae bacterium]|nr:MAG: hypothetical protein FD128_679 [Hyphomonadaceae bacterium]KAF0183899.1 MAG: hypothetical protein FD163_2093 [Hyphomonadaceae bacterium]
MSKSKKIIIDNDNPEWTDEIFAKSIDVRGKSLVEAANALRRARGKQIEPKKIPISIRLSENVISHFKAGGMGWQSRIEQALQDVIAGK